MQNVLFVSPNVGGFYKVMIEEMNRQGYEVDYISDKYIDGDPFYVRGNNNKCSEEYLKKIKDKRRAYWESFLNKSEYDKIYDILFVIDGKVLDEYLFDTLRKRNPQLKTINYLYDTTRSIYRFDMNFHFFGRVITFDREDAQTYNLEFLPIPWFVHKTNSCVKYKMFGLGTYIPSRYTLYKFVEDIANSLKQNSYIKLYSGKVSLYPIKYIYNLFSRTKPYLPPYKYYSNLIVHSFISQDEFSRIMDESEIVIDSIDSRQDGLTARCTWALGAEKKIITDNVSVKLYDFYTPGQIFVIEDYSEKTKKKLIQFIDTPYSMDAKTRELISYFRIDNWIKNVLS